MQVIAQDWIVTNESQCISLASIQEDLQENSFTKKHPIPYRLYRFLTDVENIIWQEADDRLRLQKICPLVRRLLNDSEWILTSFASPDRETGWSVQMIYDEPDFALTVQTVAWSPQRTSSIHNHATWGIVALIDGADIYGITDYSKRFEFDVERRTAKVF